MPPGAWASARAPTGVHSHQLVPLASDAFAIGRRARTVEQLWLRHHRQLRPCLWRSERCCILRVLLPVVAAAAAAQPTAAAAAAAAAAQPAATVVPAAVPWLGHACSGVPNGVLQRHRANRRRGRLPLPRGRLACLQGLEARCHHLHLAAHRLLLKRGQHGPRLVELLLQQLRRLCGPTFRLLLRSLAAVFLHGLPSSVQRAVRV